MNTPLLNRQRSKPVGTWKLLAVFSLVVNAILLLLSALPHLWQTGISPLHHRPLCPISTPVALPGPISSTPAVHDVVPKQACHTSKQLPSAQNQAWLATLHTRKDPVRRHFLGKLPQLQPHYLGPSTITQLNRSEPVFATFTNAAPVYVEQLLNWAYHLRELGLPHLVVCLDDESLDIARVNGIPWIEVANKTTSQDVRNDHATFRAMVSHKVDLARSLLEEHGFEEVIWTDTDVVWLRDPAPFFALHPSADMAVQTDCLSHTVEAAFTQPQPNGFARCGHLPGSSHSAFNTGMLLLRDRPATRAFMRNWLEYLLDAGRMYADLGGGATAVVGDQLALNKLMAQGALPWESVDAAADWRVVRAHDKQLKLLPLPTLMFSGGHSFFVQHQAQRFNSTPFYAHACLVPGHVPAKVVRFKEHGLWAIEDDAYYNEGSFLLYENTVQAFISGLEAKAKRGIPDLYKHMLAVSYQQEVALEAMAMAHALNRTIIFPKLWCWCDFDWYAVVLDGCAMGGRPGLAGADLFVMPFECPIDVLLDAAALYRHGGAYRQERFLHHPRTTAALARSREPVQVVDGADAELMRVRQRMVDNTFTGAFLPTGSTDEGIRARLRPWRHTRVLDMRNLVPGTFAGFTHTGDAAAVDAWAFQLFGRKTWCCSGEQPMAVERLEWPYVLPERLGGRVHAPGTLVLQAPQQRAVPQYRRPDFCDEIPLDPVNAKFLEFENHPCTYLAMDLGLAATVREALAG
eukprot:jgi/Ulvmu1/1448/UM011_0178.1